MLRQCIRTVFASQKCRFNMIKQKNNRQISQFRFIQTEGSKHATLANEQQSSASNNIQVKVNENRKVVSVHFDGKEYKYPSVWLRDNCQCSQCYHSGSNSRIINWENFDINVIPVEIENTPDSICIKWSDDHESNFKHDWLEERNFTTDRQKQYLHEFYRPIKHLWPKSEFKQILKSFEFKDVIENDAVLKEWLQCLAVYGVSIIHNTPHNENEARRLCNRVGFIKKTHFGEEYIVAHNPEATNRAYLSAHLQLHTDLPYYEYTPGMTMLHCLVQSKSKGGENMLVDGFYVAEKMRSEYPEMFKALTTTLVNWNDVGHEDGNHFHSIYRAPVISLLKDGQIEQIKYSVPQRDSFFSVSFDVVQSWYEAHAKFVQLMMEESVFFKTKAGDILAFNNLRMVHGRTEYTDKDDNSRFLIGAYVDWDEIYSALRVLNTQKKTNK